MAELTSQLAALATMSLAQLRDRWTEVYGTAVPRLNADLLRLGIAYRMQEIAGKPLSPAVLRHPSGSPGKPTPARQAVTLRPGAQLIRTWHGRTISVAVEESGFLFEGRPYSSLTSIAREVTGAAWSGPRFFGLGASR